MRSVSSLLRFLLLPLAVSCLDAAAQEQTVPAAPVTAEKNSAETPPSEAETETLARSISGRFQLQAAKSDWADLLREHIAEFSDSAEAQNITPSLIRRLRQDIESILATEGYFSPEIEFDNPDQTIADPNERTLNKRIRVAVNAGLRTQIGEVNIRLNGDLAKAVQAQEPAAIKRQAALVAEWGLPSGQPFREDDWSRAKTQLTENLRANLYASAKISDSAANVDADHQRADILIDVDSGPPFYFGDLHIAGLQRYPSQILDRYAPPRKGEPYSRTRLLEFQRTLQNSPYFASVAVGIDPDPDLAEAVPVDVTLVERKPRDLSFGAGYSSNTGFRSEVAYRDRDILGKAWDLRSAIRIEQKRQLGYADIYLPPADNKLDSFGVIVDRQDVSGVLSLKNAVGIKRTSTRGHLEQRLGLNLVRVKQTIDGEPEEVSKALVASVGWTWRDVDNTFGPRRGEIYQLDLAASEKALLSDQRFIRAYAKYQRWIPVGKSDSIIVRAEAGQVFASGDQGIPDDYLFRTGGSTTVRGYAYQSLGIQVPGAVTGGRVMSVASAEYLHWITHEWGAATFVDVGDAADTWREMSLKQALGIGGRYRTPAGPIALDLAYGRQTKKFRLDFSIAIAF